MIQTKEDLKRCLAEELNRFDKVPTGFLDFVLDCNNGLFNSVYVRNITKQIKIPICKLIGLRIGMETWAEFIRYMKRFMKTPSILAFAKELINGNRCHTTRSLRHAHFGRDAQKKV